MSAFATILTGGLPVFSMLDYDVIRGSLQIYLILLLVNLTCLIYSKHSDSLLLVVFMHSAT